ncbi:MAG: WecB/TagA/CpsF family glycosyltransferase [Cyanobacteria bacterium J06635_15]
MYTGSHFEKILGVRVDATNYQDVCDRIQFWKATQRSCYIVAANVHMLMTTYWQPNYRRVLQRAALVTPDGMPLVWGLRLLGIKQQPRVYGPDLMLAWCDRAAQIESPIYLYGGTPEMLTKLRARLQQQYPNLKIAGYHSPPFRTLTPQEEAQDIKKIHQSGAEVVFVGLGCPKQEYWMARQAGQLRAVMVGVGAAFSFHSGEVSQAPRWMMKSGLEWLFRLWQEPQRLWVRYLLNNPLFLILFGLQMVKHFFIATFPSSKSLKPHPSPHRQ